MPKADEKASKSGGFSRAGLKRFPEIFVPECAGFSAAFKDYQQAHRRTMQLLVRDRRWSKRQAGWHEDRQKSPKFGLSARCLARRSRAPLDQPKNHEDERCWISAAIST
jgi:hypothetical protein